MKFKRSILQTSPWLSFFFVLLMATSCGTDDPERQAARDREKILEYLADNNLTAIEHESGIFYHVQENGAGSFPSSTSIVMLSYTGRLLNGNIFDQGGERVFNLTTAITGFRHGVQLFNRGAKGFIIVPSGLAYGAQGTPTIAPNSILKFELEIIDFRN